MRSWIGWLFAFLLLISGTGMAAEGEPAPESGAEPVVERIVVDIPEGGPEAQDLTEMARSLIYLREGEPFSPRRFQQSVDALRKSGLFRKIDIPDPDFESDRITLTFRLVPFPRIKDIKIDGGFPLLEREILGAMTVFTGDAYRESAMEASEEGLKDLFRRQGFVDPKIDLVGERDPEGRSYVVHVKIHKGRFYQVKDVAIEGNQAFSEFRLELRLSTSKAALLPGGMGRFIEEEMEADRKNLLEFYRKHHYPEAEVAADVEKDKEKATARVRFIVEEGPRYDIDFEGNEAFWNWQLKKELVLFDRGNAGGLGMRRSINNIEEKYREDGFLQVRVQTEEETERTESGAVRRIRIRIEEGPQSVVESVAVKGAETVAEGEVRGQILTRTPGILAEGGYVPSVVDDDRKAIRALYRKEGYLDVEVETDADRGDVDEEGRRPVSVAYQIQEGIQTRVEAVRIEGLTAVPASEAQAELALRPGEPYREFMISSDENTLSAMISERGYPHVSVTGRAEISEDGRRAEVTYRVTQGPYVETGDIYFTGNFDTREHVLRQEVDLKPGEPFSLKDYLETERNLREIGALEAVYYTPLGLEEKADRVNLLVAVEERKPYLFEIGAGYDTAREFFVQGSFENRNLLGLNLRGWVSGEYSGIGYRAETGLTEPRLLGSRIETTASVFAEELEELNQNFGVRAYGAQLGFRRAFGLFVDGSLNFRYESREQYTLDDGPIPAEDAALFERRSVLVATPALVFDSTDSFVRPTRGARISASVDISKGLKNSLDDFFKYRLDGRYYYSPLDRLTFAVRGRYGFIDPFDTGSNIPDDQLFFLGGIGDVRGFKENRLRFDADGDPVGGEEVLLGSVEARVDVGFNFEWALFYDVGSVREPTADFGSDDFRSAVGTGLRYHTPIGPIGLLYGHKLDPKENESAGRFHFSIGYSF
ncbi:MAG: outer membrane protein assembly factor BamA [Desulfococcaceae bacterium]